VQAKQIAYHDRDRLLADPSSSRCGGALISKVYAMSAPSCPRDRALPWDLVPSYGTLAGDTVFVCAVDAEGNAAALIQSSTSLRFGVVAGDTGIVLQNRSAYFSLDPQHPTARARQAPDAHADRVDALKDGRLEVLGCMARTASRRSLAELRPLIDFGFDIQQALEMRAGCRGASVSATRATCSISKGDFRRRP